MARRARGAGASTQSANLNARTIGNSRGSRRKRFQWNCSELFLAHCLSRKCCNGSERSRCCQISHDVVHSIYHRDRIVTLLNAYRFRPNISTEYSHLLCVVRKQNNVRISTRFFSDVVFFPARIAGGSGQFDNVNLPPKFCGDARIKVVPFVALRLSSPQRIHAMQKPQLRRWTTRPRYCMLSEDVGHSIADQDARFRVFVSMFPQYPGR